MQKQREPETVELIWDFWVQERKKATHVIHTVNLAGTDEYVSLDYKTSKRETLPVINSIAFSSLRIRH